MRSTLHVGKNSPIFLDLSLCVDSLKVVYPSILVTLGLATIPVILETKIADIYVIYITPTVNILCSKLDFIVNPCHKKLVLNSIKIHT